jgi:hypothetical protein
VRRVRHVVVPCFHPLKAALCHLGRLDEVSET